jgi:glycosyltransferase involved in cell wall biosynthesis
MKIAVVAPVMIPVPPLKYGGIERDVYELACGLAGRGHSVTVFCAQGSTIEGENIERAECPIAAAPGRPNNREGEVRQILDVLARQDEFDVINFHYEPKILSIPDGNGEINILDSFTTPVVCSFHNLTDIPENIEYYRSHPSLYRHTATFVSERQRSFVPFFPDSHVIYNGMPIEKFPFERDKENYLLFLGRITPGKGILEAIRAAELSDSPLVIIARIDPADREFYEKEVQPHIDGKKVAYIGEKDFAGKVEYLKRTKCVLFSSLWEESFGLVIVESLACGTPVIAFRKGAAPELIEDKVTGRIVETVEEMAEAVGSIGTIDPAICRASVEEKFHSKRMTDKFEALFDDILRRA